MTYMNPRTIQPLTPEICAACPIRGDTVFRNFESSYLEGDNSKAQKMEQWLFNTGENICNAGDLPSHYHVVFSGMFFAYVILSSGKRHIINFFMPGDLFCFQVDSNGKMLHSVASLQTSISCAFPINQVHYLLNTSPNFSQSYHAMILQTLEHCQRNKSTITAMNAKQKIVALILEFASRQPTPTGNSINIPFPLTQEHIADTLGLTVVHVNRVMRQLSQEKVFSYQHQQIHIPNINLMREIVD
jgi:CRP/FNR family transcriptional regulator, anaerobic regulatory protein